jgi:hypothetical protein
MLYQEFAYSDHPTVPHSNICSLYVPEDGFGDLRDIRLDHGDPTQIIAVRSLARSFSGYSVDVACGSPDQAARLMFNWYAVDVVRAFMDEADMKWRRAASGCR